MSAIILNPDLAGDSFAESHSGLLLPERFAKRPRGVDLFAGIGGCSLGFIQAGFEVVAACDIGVYEAITYMHNLGQYPCKFHFIDPSDEQRLEAELQKQILGRGRKKKVLPASMVPRSGAGWMNDHPEHRGVGHFFLGDCRNLSGRQILDAVSMEVGELDCVFGGPPCQGFSTAGKRDVMDPRNSLVFEFARLVCEMRPKTIIMENVPGMLNMVTPEGIPIVDALCRILEDGGFATFDGIKHSLLASPGRAAAFRDSKPKKLSAFKPKVADAAAEGEDDTALPLFAASDCAASPLLAATEPVNQPTGSTGHGQ